MEWQTKVSIEWPYDGFTYGTRFYTTGSCFAGVLSDRLRQLEFDVAPDAFGVLFNPASIASALERVIHNRAFTEEELIETPGGIVSLAHHSSFTQPSRAAFLKHANELLQAAAQAFACADVVVVSFGTSWVFRHQGKVVANCHRLSAAQFEREFLSASQTVALWKDLITRFPEKTWVFTVSPVRHLADGAHGNQLSKASLLLAVTDLQTSFPNVRYFPAYEILLDELRDYRFYAADRCHPSEEAREYIWQRFLECAFTQKTKQQVGQMDKLKTALSHRVRFPDAQENKLFQEKTACQLSELRQEIAFERNNY